MAACQELRSRELRNGSRSGEQNGVVEIRLGITYERENRAGERWRDVWPASWDSAV